MLLIEVGEVVDPDVETYINHVSKVHTQLNRT